MPKKPGSDPRASDQNSENRTEAARETAGQTQTGSESADSQTGDGLHEHSDENEARRTMRDPEVRRLLELIAQNPDGASWARRRLAWLYSQAGRPDLALEQVHILAAAAGPSEASGWLLTMGQLHEQQGDYAAALQNYRQARAQGTANTDVDCFIHNNLGFCLNHFRRYVEAEPLLRHAMGLRPRRHNAYKNLGVALDGQGRAYEAARMYLRAAELEPDDRRALRHLEALVAAHPDLLLDVGVDVRLTACRLREQLLARQRLVPFVWSRQRVGVRGVRWD